MSNPEATGKRKESAKQRYIRLLKLLDAAPGPMHTDEMDSGEDLMAFEELVRDDFISGKVQPDSRGAVSVVFNMRITVKGRLFLEDLEKAEDAKTSLGLIKQHRFAAYKWFMGMGGSIVLGYFLKDFLTWWFSN